MKISKDKLKRIIKEELDKVMKEGVGHVFGMDYLSGRHKGLFDQAIQQLNKAKQSGEDFARVNISGMQFILKGGDEGATVQYVGSKPGIYVEGPKVPRFSIEAIDDKGDKFLAQLSAGKQEFYQDQAAAQNKQIQKIYEGGLEEIKGAAGSALAGLKKGRNLTGIRSPVKSAVDDVAYGLDEPDPNQDWYDPDEAPGQTKDEAINNILQKLGINPSSKLGMQIASELRAAGEKVHQHAAAAAGTWAADPLRNRARAQKAGEEFGDNALVKSGPRKGMMKASKANALKKNIKKGLGLEEIKGEKGRALSKFKGSWARTLGHQDTTGAGDVGSVIKNIRMANDERDEEEDDIYGPTVTKDEIIDDLLVNLEIDPQSKLAIDLRNALKAAAKENSVRNAEKVADILRGGSGEMHGDLLAQRKPANITQKGKASKDSIKGLKYLMSRAAGQGGLKEEELDEVKAHGGAEEKGEHKGETAAEKAKHEKGESAAKEKEEHDKKKMEEAQVEELRESFRRFTKLPKAVLKD